MNPFELRQTPSPSNSAHEPNAQFCAVGGLAQMIFDALQFQRTEFAADQPAPCPFAPRYARFRPLPSIRTLSKSVPLAQLSMPPLSAEGKLASHCTNAFGPAAQ